MADKKGLAAAADPVVARSTRVTAMPLETIYFQIIGV